MVTEYPIVSVPAVTPLTIPVEPTVAVALLLLHVPPPIPSVNMIDELTHTLAAPVILPAFGSGLTTIDLIAIAVPQPLVTEYPIVSVPAVTPVTIPVEPTVAVALLLLHVPPV